MAMVAMAVHPNGMVYFMKHPTNMEDDMGDTHMIPWIGNLHVVFESDSERWKQGIEAQNGMKST